ncbi:MAG TPA: HEPN/Toprim-associated domain-containing protein [Candidatus Angelobacter sp.]
MGSEIRLGIGNFDVDWGRNEFFNYHGALFQNGDLSVGTYRYYDSRGKRIIEKKPVYARPLRAIVHRLDLLGYTVAAARQQYNHLLELNRHKVPIDFESLRTALHKMNVTEVSAEYGDDFDFGEFFSEEIYDRLDLENFVSTKPSKSDLGEVMGNFHPWYVLRLLGEKSGNLDLKVTWYFADLVQDGWAEQEEFVPRLQDSERFLIVTEGSSDAKVIRKALEILYPEIVDFFYFVDMEEGYPFSGTGNLYRFCQGLAGIKVLNQVIVVYDNDAEGFAKCLDTQSLTLPPNMRVMRLPDITEFGAFPTLGPNGGSVQDINGRAAAMECYLDLTWKSPRKPSIRWVSFNEKLGCYHGVLIGKERYAREFLSLRRREPHYNFEKIKRVLDLIFLECVQLVEPE